MTTRLLLRTRSLLGSFVIWSSVFISCSAQAAEFKFDFSSGKGQSGYTEVTPQTVYNAQSGFGFMESGNAKPGSEQKVPVIDLNAMSMKFYRALGPDKSIQAFVFYPVNTFPGQEKELKDNTHHSVYGAYELARCVVEGIKANVPELAPHLTVDAGTFDPANPDPLENVQIPLSPLTGKTEKPAGN